MSTIKITESPEEIDKWITGAHAYMETTLESIKDDPQFLEWAADRVRPDMRADGGMHGRDIDDCAHDWFERYYMGGLPPFPSQLGWGARVTFGGYQEFFVSLQFDERTIPDSDLTVKLWRGMCLSYGDERADSITDAVAERPHITISGNHEEIMTTRAARALAAALMDFADEIEAMGA